MTDNTPAALTQDPTVTYGHCNDPTAKVRFRQFAKDQLPVWAVDVQPETEPAESVASGGEVVAQWVDDPHDIEQGQILNPAWLVLHGLSPKQFAASHTAIDAAITAQPRTLDAPVSEVDYVAAIAAAKAKNSKWVPGTGGCIAFAKGAEWQLAAGRAPVAQTAPVAPIPDLPESDDTALLNKLQSLAEDGHVSICFEFDGGFHVTYDPVGGKKIAARQKDTVRDGIRWHLNQKTTCGAPPPGWECSRQAGHDGPCAARRIEITGEGS